MFSGSVVCGIFLDQELNLSPELAGRFLTTGPQGKSLLFFLLFFCELSTYVCLVCDYPRCILEICEFFRVLCMGAQWCLTLRPPGTSVHGIFQARILKGGSHFLL